MSTKHYGLLGNKTPAKNFSTKFITFVTCLSKLLYTFQEYRSVYSIPAIRMPMLTYSTENLV